VKTRMRTSRVGHWKKSKAGFTLLELTVVVALIALLSMITMPQVGHLLQPDVERDVQRELENMLLAVRNETILSRHPLAVAYNLEQGLFRSAGLTEKLEISEESDDLSLRRHLPEGLTFMDIITPRDGKVTQGYCFTVIRPDGWIEPTIVHVRDEQDQEFSLLVEPLAGTILLKKGYVERWATVS
jgi:prepilin-type N-terminal cleavage/methylation domain-containing protein